MSDIGTKEWRNSHEERCRSQALEVLGVWMLKARDGGFPENWILEIINALPGYLKIYEVAVEGGQ